MLDDPLDETSGDLGARPTLRLQRRQVVAIGLVAVLLVVNQLLVQPPLLRMALDAPAINEAGRQRMLSQRLAKASLAAVRAVDHGEVPERWREEVLEVRGEWAGVQDRLRRDAEASGDEATRRAFAALDPTYRRMAAASSDLAKACRRPVDLAAATRSLQTILAGEQAYLEQMDRIVTLFQSQAQARVDRLLWTGRAATAMALLGLVAIAGLVLRPATRLIQFQVEALRQARQELETRVRERTASLEAVNSRLHHESAERSRAELRHRALLEMVSHASRTQTLGEMASGLAHELNQPLGAVANYAEGCLVALGREEPDLPEVAAALGKIRSSALRAGEILKRIRRFVTRHDPTREPFAPNAAVDEVAALLADDARARGIRLRTDLAPGLPYLVGDAVQIQQVLINLARNAMEAVQVAQPEQRQVVMSSRFDGETAVVLEVSDTGEGITAENLTRIFDTYFSTRAEGMGMGLAISRTIVEAHEGTLTVESRPGSTTFRVRLPRDRASEAR